eukprot:746780-Hanusia_phi.AAC.2
MLMASFDGLQEIFLESESWAIPLLPFHSSFLDLILALDTCASYRRHMGKNKHPWLQVEEEEEEEEEESGVRRNGIRRGRGDEEGVDDRSEKTWGDFLGVTRSQVFISCAVGTFGGTTVAALFLGQPPGWMGSLSSPFAFLLAFWLIFCCPGYWRYLRKGRKRGRRAGEGEEEIGGGGLRGGEGSMTGMKERTVQDYLATSERRARLRLHQLLLLWSCHLVLGR